MSNYDYEAELEQEPEHELGDHLISETDEISDWEMAMLLLYPDEMIFDSQ